MKKKYALRRLAVLLTGLLLFTALPLPAAGLFSVTAVEAAGDEDTTDSGNAVGSAGNGETTDGDNTGSDAGSGGKNSTDDNKDPSDDTGKDDDAGNSAEDNGNNTGDGDTSDENGNSTGGGEDPKDPETPEDPEQPEEPEEPVVLLSRRNVETHTPDEVRAYVTANGVNVNGAITYEAQPSATAPYSTGALSAETKQETLSLVNFIRYLAGIKGTVLLDEEYGSLSQSAALINAANGTLSHAPAQPADMAEDLYRAGYTGSGRSNLGTGYASLTRSILDGWMTESSATNITTVGHRRWILNPGMARTGFGAVPMKSNGSVYMTAMYAFDRSRTDSDETGISWPAAVMPTALFSADAPWSVSFGTALDPYAVQVSLKNTTTGEAWHFSATGSNGDFYVNNAGYGQTGCVIFRPEGVEAYADGDVFTVSITGLGTADGYADDVTYSVRFISLENAAGDGTDTPKPGEKTDDKASDDGKDASDGSDAPAVATKLLYRLYNPYSGEHLYTAAVKERNHLIAIGWKYEGVAWYAPEASGTPVYRLYNANSGEHHYTTSEGEKLFLLHHGWRDEGIGWYSDDAQTTPLYRLYNPNAVGIYEAGAHLYTINAVERDALSGIGWSYEGIGWYGM